MNTKCIVECLQRYGVWADWDHPYLTLDPEYEAAQVASTMFYVVPVLRFLVMKSNGVKLSCCT